MLLGRVIVAVLKTFWTVQQMPHTTNQANHKNTPPNSTLPGTNNTSKVEPAGNKYSWNAPSAVLLGLLIAAGTWFGGLIPFLGVFVVGLVGLIVIHELAHLWVGRAAGMKPTEFQVGFGKQVFAVTRPNGFTWSLRAIPAGGAVKFRGMTPRENVPADEEAGTYRAASHFGRISTVFAGPASNLLVAILLFSVGFGVVGVPTQHYLVTEIASGTQAAVELEIGDRLTNNQIEQINTYGPAWGVTGTQTIHSSTRVGLVESTKLSVEVISEVSTATLSAFKTVISAPHKLALNATNPTELDPDTPRFLSPVGLVTVASHAADSGLFEIVMLIGLISVALGVVNLLPLPPFDGGHIVVAASEWVAQQITRRPVVFDANKLAPVAVITLALFGLLSLSALWLDVVAPLPNPF